ncbi:MAG TPA: glycosyltransferase family 1 protein [Candidatus Dormibacteraeota bacterium]
MEIGIDASRAFQERATGIGVYATEVIARLALAPPAPLRLYLNRKHPPADAPRLGPGSEWRCLPLPRGWTRFRLRWEVRRRPPELLWIPAYRLPPGPVPRSVVTVHGVEHRFAPSAYPGRQAAAVESFVKDSLERAARLIVPSETTKADLVNLYGAEPSRITVIPHGVGSELRPLPPDQRHRLLAELDVSEPYFLVVGAHHPRKNLAFLVERMAQAFPPPSPVRLVVTNAGGLDDKGLGAPSTAGLGDRLQLLGHLSGERLAALYGGALAACVPSLYEGFGLPVLEAMACGAPVLANDVGGLQEVGLGAALLVSASDGAAWGAALQRLESDQGLRQHLSARGRERAAGYTWERSAQAHGELLAAELRLAEPATPRA